MGILDLFDFFHGCIRLGIEDLIRRNGWASPGSGPDKIPGTDTIPQAPGDVREKVQGLHEFSRGDIFSAKLGQLVQQAGVRSQAGTEKFIERRIFGVHAASPVSRLHCLTHQV